MAQPAGLITLQNDARANINLLTEALTNDRITLDEYREAMLREIKRAHIAAVEMGRRGRANVTPTDWGRLGARLRQEYGFLNAFMEAIANGELSVNEIFRRAQMYANHVQVSYWDARRQRNREAGRTQERRRTQRGDNCTDCKGYEAEGWQEIGYFPPPGLESVCVANCNCTMEFR